MRGTPFLALAATVLLAACGGQATPASPAPSKPASSAPASPSPAVSAAAKAQAVKTIWGVGAGSLVQFVPDLIVEKGFLSQHGLEMDRRAMTAVTASDALGADEIDFTTYSSSAARAAAKGLPVRVVAVMTTGSWSLIGQPDLKSVADLKGKTIGITAVGTDESAYLKTVVEKAGMSINDVTQLSLAQEGPLVAALESKSVSAVVLVPPWTQLEKAKGYVQLATPSAVRFSGGGLATRTKLMQQKPEVVQGVLQGLVDTVEWTLKNPDEVIDFFSRKYNLERPIAADGYKEQMASLAFNLTDDELMGTFTRSVGAGQETNALPQPSQVYDLTVFRSLVAKAGLTNYKAT
jgi:NitT/TauT family transport system substrate-binding protein